MTAATGWRRRAAGALPRVAAEHRLYLGRAERRAVRGAARSARAGRLRWDGCGAALAVLGRGASVPARGGARLRLSGSGAARACVPPARAGDGRPVDERLEVRRLRAAGGAGGAEGALPRALPWDPGGDAAGGGLCALPRQAAGRALCLRHRHAAGGGGVAAGVPGDAVRGALFLAVARFVAKKNHLALLDLYEGYLARDGAAAAAEARGLRRARGGYRGADRRDRSCFRGT